MFGIFVTCLYGGLALIGLLNLILMIRPHPTGLEKAPLVLIPARNEANNLAELIPLLRADHEHVDVIVFDDESSDETSQVALNTGARVLRPQNPLPSGWTGKNRACHELALAAEATDHSWWLFLDADVRPYPGFLKAIASLCNSCGPETGMVTGFPHVKAGEGLEPLFLAWVGWILLATIPYGLINRSGLGHSRFKNGQCHCWRREVYMKYRPNEAVKSQIMEDVMIGRLLAKNRVAVLVANLSSYLSVKMYSTWRETLDGMSKNSFEITGSVWGSVLVSIFFLFLGWSWLFAGAYRLIDLVLFTLSGLWVCLIARTVLWPLLFGPLIPTIGAFTILRSTWWHRMGVITWKGRSYDRRQGK